MAARTFGGDIGNVRARTPMAEEYAAYRQRTGFFWPKFS